MEKSKKTEEHLIDLILERNNSTPNFALFIGAGASVSSGVKLAAEMVEEWRYRLYEESHSREKYEDWLSKQEWFNSDKEYSILFEKVCDTPAQRRTCVENCVKDAKPSWGYMYLANLINNHFFNVIFTTNFDDLANEACFLYAELNPIVCAHDSAVANVRVTSARPKIIKLHGDFLYDDIKSTVPETSRLEQNMEDKFTQFAREYGLVVVGYGGKDDSIIMILKKLVETEGYFPHGIYWCFPTGAELSKKAKELIGMNRVYWVEIRGFDEFMADLHKKSRLQLPDLIKDPYKATTGRLNTFISRAGMGLEEGGRIQNPIILEDMNQLQKTIKAFEGAISGKEEEVLDKLVPYAFLGRNAYLGNEYHDAITYFKKAQMLGELGEEDMEELCFSYLFIEDFENAQSAIAQMMQAYPEMTMPPFLEARLYHYTGHPDKALVSLREALSYSKTNETKASVLTAFSNIKLLMNDFDGALADAEESVRLSKRERSAADINHSIALKKLGRVGEATKILDDVLKRETGHYLRACTFAALGNKRDMLKELEEAVETDISYIIAAKTDPDFIDYRDDPEFRQIVYRQKPKK
jgi:tetratricopeptide (TPR) repeat protein